MMTTEQAAHWKSEWNLYLYGRERVTLERTLPFLLRKLRGLPGGVMLWGEEDEPWEPPPPPYPDPDNWTWGDNWA